MSAASVDRAVAPLVLAAVLISAAAAVFELGFYLPSYNTPHTSLEGAPHPAGASPLTPGLTRKLSLVLVDGLSYESAAALPALAPLRRNGVFRPLRAEFPTYTSPALVGLVTGLSPRDSGIRLNGDLDRAVVGLDRVTTAAVEAGTAVRLWGREWKPFGEAIAPGSGAEIRFGRADFLAFTATAPLSIPLPPLEPRAPARMLEMVYLGEVDETAHAHGTLGPEYREAEAIVTALLGRYAATLDRDQDSLIVMSDHGHRPEGGHGGVEPEAQHAFLLAQGPLLRQGVELGERPIRDVASTLSLLAGLRPPSSNLGRPMLDLLSLGDREQSFLFGPTFEQAARFTCRLSPSPRCGEVDALLERLRKADPEAAPEAEAMLDALTAARAQELADRRDREGLRRLGIAAAALGIAGGIAWLLARRRRPGGIAAALADPVSWALPLLFATIYVSVLWAGGYRPTFSTMKSGPGYMLDAFPVGLLSVLVTASFAWIARPRRLAPWILLFATAIPFGLLCAYVGADPTTLPPPLPGILVFELGPGIVAAAAGAVAVALVQSIQQRRRAARELPSPPRRDAPSAEEG